MSNESSTPVASKTLRLGGHSWPVYYAAVRFEAEQEAEDAFLRAEKQKYDGNLISVYRVTDPSYSAWLVVAISEAPEPIVTAREVLADGGTIYDAPDNLILQVYRRRIRLALDNSANGEGPLDQRAHYGRSGARLDKSGQVRSRKRPSGG